MIQNIFETTIPNGIKIFIEPIPYVKSCSIAFWIRTGSCHELNEEEGLSHFIEHMVFKGTEKYNNSQKIAEIIDNIGGDINAFTDKEVTCFYGKVLKEQAQNLILLLSEFITKPLLRMDDIVKERKVIIEEINQNEDQPDDLANELFYSNFWPNGPLSRPILGTKEKINNYDDTQIKSFFKKVYQAQNIFITISGNIEIEKILPLIENTLRFIPNNYNVLYPKPNKSTPFLLNINKKELQQNIIIMGFPSYPHGHHNLTAASILNYVLGGSMASRLFMELRDKHALCYQIDSDLNHYYDTGLLQIIASCSPIHSKKLIRNIITVLSNLISNGLTVNELERAKLQLRTNIIFHRESTSSIMFAMANQFIYNHKIITIEEQLKSISTVTIENINQVIKDILIPEALSIFTLGNNNYTKNLYPNNTIFNSI